MQNIRELAWAAGIFEGEGSLSLAAGKYPRITVSMTDEDTMRRFARAMEVGKIYGPYTRGRHKPYHAWTACTFEDVQYAVCLIWFGLGQRRRDQTRKTLRASVVTGHSVKWRTCKNGHAWTPDNIISQASGYKRCRTCRLAYSREWKRRQRELSH